MIAGVLRRSVEVKHLSLLLGLIHCQEEEIEIQPAVEYEKQAGTIGPSVGMQINHAYDACARINLRYDYPLSRTHTHARCYALDRENGTVTLLD